jgi:ketosteroid isomerase-like protein
MSQDVPNPDLADLVRRAGDAADAFLNGEMRRYADLIPHTDDFTLFAPFGGEPRHGFDDSEDALAATAEFFQGGEAQLDLVQAHTSGDLALLVVVEREHGRIGGLPDQDLSLRVTLVFRREDGEWRLMHRHADPLVHPIGLEQFARLARDGA